jgi:N-acetylglucosamine-6-phosphate deacetylase
MPQQAYVCTRVVTPRNTLAPAEVRVEEGRIVSVGPPGRSSSATIELPGVVIPGFIDLQVNGLGRHDVLAASRDAIRGIAKQLPMHGVTAWCPTIVSSSESDRLAALDCVAEVARARDEDRGADGARILGVHLEGPWISKVRKGAHVETALEAPSETALVRSLERHQGLVKIVTLAPELPGAVDGIKYVRSVGAIASMGHSDASFSEAQVAIDAGATMATHLFNAMRPLHHREPGIVGAVLGDQRVVAGLIADGIHVHPATVAIAFRIKGPGRVVLVSDVVAGEKASGAGSAARLKDGTLAGAFASLGDGVRECVAAGVDVGDALQAATLTPAELLRVPIGRLEPGAPADFVVVGEDLRVRATYIGGKRVWSR